MAPEQLNSTPEWGFFSPDGYFQSIASLTTLNLEYVCKTSQELKALLHDNIAAEEYERCALIRDEIARRA